MKASHNYQKEGRYPVKIRVQHAGAQLKEIQSGWVNVAEVSTSSGGISRKENRRLSA